MNNVDAKGILIIVQYQGKQWFSVVFEGNIAFLCSNVPKHK
jgi:hypothetical protein